MSQITNVQEYIKVSESNSNNTHNGQSPVLRVLAKIVTYVCHPVFMPLVGAFVLSRLSSTFGDVPEKQLNLWLLSIAVTSLGFPVFSVLLMKPLGFIESYQLPTTKDRIIPLIASMTFYFWVSHVFNTLPGVPLVLKSMLLGNFWGIIGVFMANIFVKVSMHTAGAGSMVGIMAVLMMTSSANMVIPFFISVAVAGIIGTARLYLNAHKPGDVWLGYFLGVVAQLCAYWYSK